MFSCGVPFHIVLRWRAQAPPCSRRHSRTRNRRSGNSCVPPSRTPIRIRASRRRAVPHGARLGRLPRNQAASTPIRSRRATRVRRVRARAQPDSFRPMRNDDNPRAAGCRSCRPPKTRRRFRCRSRRPASTRRPACRWRPGRRLPRRAVALRHLRRHRLRRPRPRRRRGPDRKRPWQNKPALPHLFRHRRRAIRFCAFPTVRQPAIPPTPSTPRR